MLFLAAVLVEPRIGSHKILRIGNDALLNKTVLFSPVSNMTTFIHMELLSLTSRSVAKLENGTR
jgi:hypothetical protein